MPWVTARTTQCFPTSWPTAYMCCLQRYVCSVFPGVLTKPQQKESLSTAEVHGIDGAPLQEHHGHVLQKAIVISRGYGGGYR